MSKDKIFVVIPAYNEVFAIAKVIDGVSRFCHKIIVVDDGSTDETGTRASHKKSIVLRHLQNLGQGAALQTGIDYSKKHGATIVVTFDADGQFDPRDIPKLVQPINQKKADVVLGSRFLGQALGLSFSRKLLLKVGVLFTFIFSGVKLTDTHNGFRAFNKKALQRINITQNGMAHASEIIDQIVRNGLKWVEKPVTVKYSFYSKRKGQRATNAISIVGNLFFKAIQ